MSTEHAQVAWDRMADAERALHAALTEYANALYDHNTRERGIAPLGAYRDAANTLDAKLANHVQAIRMDLQMRVADAA